MPSSVWVKARQSKKRMRTCYQRPTKRFERSMWSWWQKTSTSSSIYLCFIHDQGIPPSCHIQRSYYGGALKKRGYRAGSILSQLQHPAQNNIQHCSLVGRSGIGIVKSCQLESCLVRSSKLAWRRKITTCFISNFTDKHVHGCVETRRPSLNSLIDDGEGG